MAVRYGIAIRIYASRKFWQIFNLAVVIKSTKPPNFPAIQYYALSHSIILQLLVNLLGSIASFSQSVAGTPSELGWFQRRTGAAGGRSPSLTPTPERSKRSPPLPPEERERERGKGRGLCWMCHVTS